jgi:hypothetical protein
VVGASLPVPSHGQFEAGGPSTVSLLTVPRAGAQVTSTVLASGHDCGDFSLGRTKANSIKRRRHHHRSADYLHFVTLKLGTYNPEGAVDGGRFFGFRTGAEFDDRLTVSFNADAYWRSYTEEATIAQDVDVHGNVITTSVTSLETSSTLIPLGVSLGIRLPGSRTVTPFVGAGVAYEILVNDVRDFATGIEDTNVYGGFGWQIFGGLMVPITSGTRFLGELWFNDAEVSREVDSYSRGLPVRESIDVSGVGARLGIEFSFD